MSTQLQSIYDTRVQESVLRSDPAQRAALFQMEKLREAIESAPAPMPPSRSLFGRRRAPVAPSVACQGLYLWGDVGRGKSMLMDLFYQHCGVDKKRRVHFHSFMQQVHRDLAEARKRNVDDAIMPVAESIIRDVKLLCLDEMQITDITDAMLVGRLFEQVLGAGVFVVTTSNRPPVDLYKDGLNRALFEPFIALLEARLDVVCLEAERDYRQDRMSGTQVYFHPADVRAERALDGLWKALTSGNEHPLEIQLKGRHWQVPRFWAGHARAGFWDLCGQPLAAADYLALAERATLLMLDDIPRLDPSKFNEAKRFVTLIDVVYESKMRFVCSAADTPERLYVDGAGSFEFERTASRLREMQGADWAEGS